MRREYDFTRGKRGPVVPPRGGKSRITIRLDDDVLEWFRAQAHARRGGTYQTLINGALREFISSRREPLEETLRRVVREEWGRYEGRAGSKTPSQRRAPRRSAARA
jgi:Arc/MetJ family transcription regulator